MRFILNLTPQNAELWRERWYDGMVMNYMVAGGIWLWHVGRTYPAVSLEQDWRTYGTGAQKCTRKTSLARGIHCCPISFNSFARPASLYCDTHTHTTDCVQNVHELPFLPNNNADETFYTNREQYEVLTGYLSLGRRPVVDWANTWHWEKFLQTYFQTGSSSSRIYCQIFFLIAFLEEDFIYKYNTLYNEFIINYNYDKQ